MRSRSSHTVDSLPKANLDALGDDAAARAEFAALVRSVDARPEPTPRQGPPRRGFSYGDDLREVLWPDDEDVVVRPWELLVMSSSWTSGGGGNFVEWSTLYPSVFEAVSEQFAQLDKIITESAVLRARDQDFPTSLRDAMAELWEATETFYRQWTEAVRDAADAAASASGERTVDVDAQLGLAGDDVLQDLDDDDMPLPAEEAVDADDR